jgi:integrase
VITFHTAATHLLVAGVDVRSVSGILAHASATTTLSTYARLVVDAQRDAVEKLGDRLELMTDGNRMATAEGPTPRKRP